MHIQLQIYRSAVFPAVGFLSLKSNNSTQFMFYFQHMAKVEPEISNIKVNKSG